MVFLNHLIVEIVCAVVGELVQLFFDREVEEDKSYVKDGRKLEY